MLYQRVSQFYARSMSAGRQPGEKPFIREKLKGKDIGVVDQFVGHTERWTN